MSTSSNYFLHVLWRLAVLLSPVLPVQAAPEVGNDWAIHGFVSLGYIQSEGNNFYGKTLRSAGDVDYYEAGLNAFQSWGPNFSVAGQLLSRQAGRTEAGRPQIDYAFVDFHPDDGHYGLRLGRVKNPMGFLTKLAMCLRPVPRFSCRSQFIMRASVSGSCCFPVTARSSTAPSAKAMRRPV